MQSIPLAVLKLVYIGYPTVLSLLHAIHTACGIETFAQDAGTRLLEQLHAIHTACGIETPSPTTLPSRNLHCMQSIPLAVLKRASRTYYNPRRELLHAIHTACGIETLAETYLRNRGMRLHAIHTACGIETSLHLLCRLQLTLHAIHTACGIETSMSRT